MFITFRIHVIIFFLIETLIQTLIYRKFISKELKYQNSNSLIKKDSIKKVYEDWSFYFYFKKICVHILLSKMVFYIIHACIVFTVIYHLHIYLIIPVIIKILDEEEDFQSTMVCEGIPSTASSKNQIENYS